MIRDFTTAAIIDTNYNAPISVEGAHPHSGAEGKCSVRGGQLLLIVNLSTRRQAPMVWRAVPTRDTGFGRLRNGLCACSVPQSAETRHWKYDSSHNLQPSFPCLLGPQLAGGVQITCQTCKILRTQGLDFSVQSRDQYEFAYLRNRMTFVSRHDLPPETLAGAGPSGHPRLR